MTIAVLHCFDPATAWPVAGTRVDLGVLHIKDDGIRELRQSPGAVYCDWSMRAESQGPGSCRTGNCSYRSGSSRLANRHRKETANAPLRGICRRL